MTMERPADEIGPGDVIEYAPGGLMLVTIPGEAESIRFVGRRVGHHGVTLTVPEGVTSDVYAVGKAMSTLHTPRGKVTVHERRAFAAGDRCPCDHHRKRRGESAPMVLPPVVAAVAELPAAGAAPVTDAPVTGSAAVTSSAPVRRRRGGPLQRPAGCPAPAPAPSARPELPAAAEPVSTPTGAAGVAHGLAVRAAVRLGEGWSAQGPRYDGEKAGYLVHTDGRRLKIAPDNRPAQWETHVRVTVEYPRDAPVKVWPVHFPETRFKHDRPVSDLVSAIRSKILPTYDAKYPEIKQLTEEYRRSIAAEESFAARIACLVPSGTLDEHDSSRVEARPFPRHIEQMTANVSTSDHLHRVEFRYIDSETLEALAQTYGAMVRAKQERAAQDRRGRSVEVR
ncbi:hypothetical protein [Streptomyces violaceusniger]|uniref:Uncharacterized protein n=1 Tax=Streptomyces violaceusniger (strain Tu 4113) TaxID=653045 RepID=G2PHQ8_STRV4|nr:hypothetical protein [Streptomyces violaceusniger]AEM88859.1 hypothetical protein Strvi_0083 [Streptomyces violaceusniger Tu 4113]